MFWKMSSGVKALLFRTKHRYMKLRQTQVIQNCSRDERGPGRTVNKRIIIGYIRPTFFRGTVPDDFVDPRRGVEEYL